MTKPRRVTTKPISPKSRNGQPPTIRSKLLDHLVEQTQSGVGGYLTGQRKMVEDLGLLLPKLGERMANFLLADVEEHVDGKGNIQRLVELKKDLSPGQVVLLKALLTRIVPGSVPMDLEGKQAQQQGPRVVNISVHTVGPKLKSDDMPGVVDGAARQVTSITFHPPVDNASQKVPAPVQETSNSQSQPDPIDITPDSKTGDVNG